MQCTHDFEVTLREIPAFVHGAMLALAHGGPAKVMVQYEAASCAEAICATCATLLDGVRDAHVRCRVERHAVHDLLIGRAHRCGSMKRRMWGGGGVQGRRRKRRGQEQGQQYWRW
jgi:hypothetical protein